MGAEVKAKQTVDSPAASANGHGTAKVGPKRRRGSAKWPDDIQVIFDKDPAARNILEVLTYQGLHAILIHRVAHKLYALGVPVIPRVMSQIARLITGGIEIHPGAKIGRRFFIDHGSGVVIGETTRIGDDVMLYHQVTLGATGWWKDMHNGHRRRHPMIEDHVTIGCGASILGPVTIGRDTKIGAMALVVEDVPPRSVVIGRGGAYLVKDGKRVHELPLSLTELPSGYAAEYQI